MVIYFSKINLESTELLKMYQEKSLDGMKKKLMNFFSACKDTISNIFRKHPK